MIRPSVQEGGDEQTRHMDSLWDDIEREIHASCSKAKLGIANAFDRVIGKIDALEAALEGSSQSSADVQPPCPFVALQSTVSIFVSTFDFYNKIIMRISATSSMSSRMQPISSSLYLPLDGVSKVSLSALFPNVVRGSMSVTVLRGWIYRTLLAVVTVSVNEHIIQAVAASWVDTA